MAALHQLPMIRPKQDLIVLHEMGIPPEKLQLTISRLALPYSEIASEAAQLRKSGTQIAYKPSILRRYPCILFGPTGRRLRAPLPDLIVSRVTSGLFYDVIGGGGAVRDDYGRRFEQYAHQLLEKSVPEITFIREWSYRVAGTSFKTPDIIALDEQNTVLFVIECKAAKMSIAARFGEDPSEERGYEEMAKGVLQLWRFFSHCRRGHTGKAAPSDAKGIPLALDDWFLARGPMIEKVIQKANILADRTDVDILDIDRRAVAFASISELENVMETATRESLVATIDLATSDDRKGWMFSSLHQDVDAPKTNHRPYPFDDELELLLPWWSLREDH